MSGHGLPPVYVYIIIKLLIGCGLQAQRIG